MKASSREVRIELEKINSSIKRAIWYNTPMVAGKNEEECMIGIIENLTTAADQICEFLEKIK